MWANPLHSAKDLPTSVESYWSQFLYPDSFFEQSNGRSSTSAPLPVRQAIGCTRCIFWTRHISTGWGGGFYHLRGKVGEGFDIYNIEVNWLQKVGLK